MTPKSAALTLRYRRLAAHLTTFGSQPHHVLGLRKQVISELNSPSALSPVNGYQRLYLPLSRDRLPRPRGSSRHTPGPMWLATLSIVRLFYSLLSTDFNRRFRCALGPPRDCCPRLSLVRNFTNIMPIAFESAHYLVHTCIVRCMCCIDEHFRILGMLFLGT